MHASYQAFPCRSVRAQHATSPAALSSHERLWQAYSPPGQAPKVCERGRKGLRRLQRVWSWPTGIALSTKPRPCPTVLWPALASHLNAHAGSLADAAGASRAGKQLAAVAVGSAGMSGWKFGGGALLLCLRWLWLWQWGEGAGHLSGFERCERTGAQQDVPALMLRTCGVTGATQMVRTGPKASHPLLLQTKSPKGQTGLLAVPTHGERRTGKGGVEQRVVAGQVITWPPRQKVLQASRNGGWSSNEPDLHEELVGRKQELKDESITLQGGIHEQSAAARQPMAGPEGVRLWKRFL